MKVLIVDDEMVVRVGLKSIIDWENNQIDLIMLGATGLNAVERLFIGSVSEYVIRNANCDVLIVRTDLDNKVPEEDD